MKLNTSTFLFLLLFSVKSFSQLGIKETNSAPHPSAMLDVDSPNKGILIPRMNTAVRDAIASPPDGLMIYNLLTKKINYFNNTAWQEALFADQWTVNSPNISYSGGFVGIGLTTPTRDLVLSSLGSPDILIQQDVFTGKTSTDGFMLGTNTSFEGEIWNFESAGIKFGTSNIERMKILANGNVGVDEPSPSEKLVVNGNIKASGNILLTTGEVNRTATGAANMVPIAYGNVAAAGTILGGTGNFTVSRLTTGIYEITVTGENITSTATYFFSTVPLSANPQFSTAYPFSGVLRVETFDGTSGSNQDGIFSFVVYKL
jgi:hypothetical protein